MPVRLTVVISQVRRGSTKQQTLEADLIAQLIARAGIDVSLIGPLSQVEQSATDRLVLEGISGDFAIVAWQTADQAMEQLAALQISGRRSAHQADPQPGDDSGRRIYCFDWGRFATAEELATALGQLLNERRVVTVSLAPPAPNPAAHSAPQRETLPVVEAGSPAAKPDRAPKPEAATPRSLTRRDQASGDEKAPPDERASGDQRPLPGRASSGDADADAADDQRERAADARLDALVDDLNRLDL